MLKKLKSLFIIEEELSASEKLKAMKAARNKGNDKPNKKTSSSTATKIPVNENVAAPDKFVNSLLQAIEKNNLEGFDYLEYKQSLRSLAQMAMDESTKFNSAFAMAKTMGASKSNLIESGGHYVKILEEEKAKFTTAYEAQQQKQVASRENRLSVIEGSLSKKQEQIKKLQGEIKNLKTEFDQKKGEINSAAAKVALTRDQFFAAFSKVKDQIAKDIEKMDKYLTK